SPTIACTSPRASESDMSVRAAVMPNTFDTERSSRTGWGTLISLADGVRGRRTGRGILALFSRRFHVVLIVDRERAHQDARGAGAVGICLDGVVTHPAGGEAVADFARDLVGGQCVGGVVGEVAEVAEAPQREFGRAAIHG